MALLNNNEYNLTIKIKGKEYKFNFCQPYLLFIPVLIL